MFKLTKELLEDYKKQMENKIPIRKGCKNHYCFCTGACQEIIKWIDKTPSKEW